jgi:hypothetical protein
MLGKKREVIIIKQNKIFFMIYKMTDIKQYDWYDNIIYKNAEHLIKKYKTEDDPMVLFHTLNYFDLRNNILFFIIVIMFMSLIIFEQIPINNYNLAVLCGFIVILGSLDYIIMNLNFFKQGFKFTAFHTIYDIKKYINEKIRSGSFQLDVKTYNFSTVDMDKYYGNIKRIGYEPYSLILSTINRWLKL